MPPDAARGRRGRAPARPGDHHRHVRRRPQHGGQVLEDLGWFVVDNLPPALLPTLAELGARSQRRRGADRRRRRRPQPARSSPTSRDALAELGRRRQRTRAIVFLEASDDALVRRFEAVRRPHPLQGDGRLVDGIARERELLRDLRGDADLVIDTSSLQRARAARQDGRRVRRRRGARRCGRRSCRSATSTACRSTPTSSSTAASCRTRTGCRSCARCTGLRRGGARLRARPAGRARSSSTATTELLELIAAGYQREGKRYVTIAVGCTGGKHRSRRHGRGARAPAADARRRHRGRPPRPGARVSSPIRGRVPGRARPSSRSAAATGWPRRCRRCAASPTGLTAVVTVADDGGSSGRLRARARRAAARRPADGAGRAVRRRRVGPDLEPTSSSTASAARASCTSTPSATC